MQVTTTQRTHTAAEGPGSTVGINVDGGIGRPGCVTNRHDAPQPDDGGDSDDSDDSDDSGDSGNHGTGRDHSVQRSRHAVPASAASLFMRLESK